MVRHGFLKLICWFSLMVLSSGILSAATITVTTDRDQVALNETFQLVFKVQGEEAGEPDFSPLNKDFQLLGTSRSSQFSIINGNTTQSKSYTLRMAPKRAGELVIPAISFGNDQSDPGRMQVLESAAAVSGTTDVEDVLKVTASVDVADPYVQQQVLLTVKIYRRVNWQQASLSELDAGGSDLLVRQLGEDKHYRTTLEGRDWEVIERKFALFPQQSGELEISPFMLTASVVDDRQQQGQGYTDPFDQFFSRRPSVQKFMRSNAVKLQVKPAVKGVLPWLAARDLKLQENWSRNTDQLQAGESVTRTIAIIADGMSVGQLTQLKPPAVAGIKSYPDQPQTSEQASSQGLLSTSSQKFALIPGREGEFEIPPLEIKWWNVNRDRMETARLPGRTLKVSGTAARMAEPRIPVQTQAPALPQNESAEDAPVHTVPLSEWLIFFSGFLLLLWLVTLYAWWRVRKTRDQGQAPSQAAVTEQSDSGGHELLMNALNKAVTEKDGAATRDAILQLAKHIWPDNPPFNLAQVAHLAQGPLVDELNNLERSLYGAGHTDWDGSLIVREMSMLRPQKNEQPSRQSALKSMYPG